MTLPSGWTYCKLTYLRFKKIFVLNAEKNQVNADPFVLWINGHDSHEMERMKQIGHDHNVIIIAFASKCTHKTQPLDVTVFGIVQRRWYHPCACHIMEGVKFNQYNVIQEYYTIWSIITVDLIKSAFRATGIHPLNQNVFTDEDYAPSQSFSVIAHAPDTYPTDVPTSPPIEFSSELHSESDPDGDSDDGLDNRTVEIEDVDYIRSDADENARMDGDGKGSTDTRGVQSATTTRQSLCSSSSGMVTCSSSTTVSVNDLLNRKVAPTEPYANKRTCSEVDMENHMLWYQQEVMANELAQLKSQLAAANVHCTVMQ